MINQPGRDRPRVSNSLPHPSWNLDLPKLFTSPATAGDDRSGERRKVTPEEIWAIVDAAS